MLELQPLSRASLPDSIVRQLLGLIRDGSLRPGDRIPSETELGATLGVGRTTVREALNSLTTMGLLQRTRQGTFVRHDAPTVTLGPGVALLQDDIIQIYGARKVLEVAFAGQAAEKASDHDLALMRQALHDLEEVDVSDPRRLIETDMAFHSRIAETAGNAILLQMFMGLRDYLITSFVDAAHIPGVQKFSNQVHREIFEAIEARDPVRARDAMHRGLSEMEISFIAFVSRRVGGDQTQAHAMESESQRR